LSEAKSRIQVLQVVRLLAAVGIFVYHTEAFGANTGGECAGVEIFFLISGFLTLYATEGKSVSPGRYLVRRLIRLVPLYWIVTLGTYGLICAKPELSVMSDTKPMHLIQSLLFIPYRSEAGYIVPVCSVGWTLNYEILFTGLFTIGLWAAPRRRAEVTAGLAALIVAAGLVFRPGGAALSTWTDPLVLEFVGGMLLERLYMRLPEKPGKGMRAAAGICAAAAIGWLIWTGTGQTAVHRCLRLGIPAFGLLLSALTVGRGARFAPPLIQLGNMTYSFYLVEYFTSAAFRMLVPAGLSQGLRGLALLAGAAVTFLLSWPPYTIIEVRLSRRLNQMFTPGERNLPSGG